MAESQDIVLIAGDTTPYTIRWQTDPFVYMPITAITNAAPARITCPLHGLTDGWPVAVVSVKGMTAINAKNTPPRASDFTPATVIDSNTVELNAVNSADYKAYTSGGYLQFYTPKSLAGYTAVLTVKDKVGGATLLTLSTGTTGITLNNTSKTIDLVFPPISAWKRGVYNLDLVDPLGAVTTLISGVITVVQE